LTWRRIESLSRAPLHRTAIDIGRHFQHLDVFGAKQIGGGDSVVDLEGEMVAAGLAVAL